MPSRAKMTGIETAAAVPLALMLTFLPARSLAR